MSVVEMTDPSTSGASFVELVAVLDRLRSPGGCPWDAKQTHASLVEYLIEESYEVVEAIDAQDAAALQEELGDLLLQVVFHARIASERVGFTIDDVATGITEKLIRRHPHVFAEATMESADQVEADWHARKAKEKGRTSVTDGIPIELPALMRASKLQARSAALQADLPPLGGQGVAQAALEELADEDDLGAFLFAVVQQCRERGWDAEGALRRAVTKRVEQIREYECRHDEISQRAASSKTD